MMVLKVDVKIPSLTIFNTSRVASSHFLHLFCFPSFRAFSLPSTPLPLLYENPGDYFGPTR